MLRTACEQRQLQPPGPQLLPQPQLQSQRLQPHFLPASASCAGCLEPYQRGSAHEQIQPPNHHQQHQRHVLLAGCCQHAQQAQQKLLRRR